MTPAATPNPITARDAAVLLGVVAVVNGDLMAGELSTRLANRLQRRLEDEGLLPPDSEPGRLLLALGDLAQRLHHALGAYPDPPAPSQGATTHVLVFCDRPSATAASTELRQDGHRASDPQPFEDPAAPWRVDVTVTVLPLTAAFDDQVRQIHETGARHGGRDSGWSSSSS